MQKAAVFAVIAGLVSAASGASGWTVPDPYVRVLSRAPVPVTVYTTPAGTGQPLGACSTGGGLLVDGTITIQLLDADQPVSGFPAEDIWLESGWTAVDPPTPFAPCPTCGSCADGPTDVDGLTTFSRALAGGGTSIADQGPVLVICVNGDVPPQDPLPGYSIVSPDLDGDLTVGLADLIVFTRCYGGHERQCDLNWDGNVNLPDLALFSAAYGEVCPAPPE